MTKLTIQELSKVYGEDRGVFDFNLNINNNDIVLLLGPNGAGKTTAFRGILGLTEVKADKIQMNGNDIKNNPKKTLGQIGAMVSKPTFYEYMTGFEYLNLFRPFYNKVTESDIHNLLSEVGLSKSKDRKISEYSTGMKQRLDFARAIIHRPEVLLLDEPFNGLDIEAKIDLKDLIKRMQSKNNMGVLISSHMVGDLENYANKVLILHEGRTLFRGDMAAVKATGLTLEEFYIQQLKIKKNMEVA